MSEIKYALMPSPLGQIAVAVSAKGIRRLALPSQLELRPFPADWQRDDSVADAAKIQLAEYFAGERRHFDLALDLQGTDFQEAVWAALQTVAYGTHCSYGELAQQIGRPKAVRALGAANGRNPVPIIVPCHRVIGANGKLTGYFGGESIKSELLALEQRVCEATSASAGLAQG
jgi:methylated-DNA-[protein]-cysteine S-methyltransferase